MSEPTHDDHLQLQRSDYVAAVTKAIVGAAPFAGSLLVELAGAVIPNQRKDRLIQFARELEQRISGLEQGAVRAQLGDATFTELLEEAMHQAARSTSDERRRYLAQLIASGLSSADIEFQESRHLLRILGEMNDIEVIWLRSYQFPGIAADKEFRHKHAKVLEPRFGIPLGPQVDIDKEALQRSYTEHLEALGVVRPTYDMDRAMSSPRFDQSTGKLKVSYYTVSSLGELLLRHIGLYEDGADQLASAADAPVPSHAR